MALALDTTSTNVDNTHHVVNDTITKAHTCTGTNLVLLVNLAIWINGGGPPAAISGIKYNGVSMTIVPSSRATNSNQSSEQWYLIAPATGTNNIVITCGGTYDSVKIANYSFTGADQTNPIDTNNTTTGTGTSISISLTLAATNEYMIDVMSHASANTPSAHSDTQVLSDATSGTLGFSQYALKAGSGSQSMSVTQPDVDPWTYSMLALKASGGTVATPRFRALLGVGL